MRNECKFVFGFSTDTFFRYDTEAECEALEKEKTALEAGLAVKERKYVHKILWSSSFNSLLRISETTEKNAFLTTRSNLKVLGLSDESEWKVRVSTNVISPVCILPISLNTGKIEIGREPQKAIRRKPLAVAIENVEIQH